VNLPAQPRIETFTYVSEYGSMLPAKRYTAEHDGTRFVMTVVDMNKTDRPRGHGIELRSAVHYAATALRRTGTVTTDIYSAVQGVPGQALTISLPDGRRNCAGVYLHTRRLYIAEAIAPANRPPPCHFHASMGFLDGAGNSVTYVENDYSFPDPPPPPRLEPR
jgi:hypothetical protein